MECLSTAEPSAGAADWLIVCDFDGTIAKVDVTDELLTRFALPEWEAVEADWKANRIDARECMERQVALIRAPRATLDAYLDTVEIDPEFSGFAADCAARGFELIVASDGLDYSIARILSRHGLGHLRRTTNCLIEVADGRYRLTFPNARADCKAGSGTCKCRASRLRAKGRARLVIGDGRSDFCVASEATFVFAKGKLLDHCQTEAIPHLSCPDFAEARRLLTELDVYTLKRFTSTCATFTVESSFNE
jgi:2,3-diketo-5-methylthio-1-phosphopentane phosphatase